MWQKGEKDGFKFWQNGSFLIEERFDGEMVEGVLVKKVRYYLFYSSRFIDKFTFLANAFKATIDYKPEPSVVVTEDAEL